MCIATLTVLAALCLHYLANVEKVLWCFYVISNIEEKTDSVIRFHRYPQYIRGKKLQNLYRDPKYHIIDCFFFEKFYENSTTTFGVILSQPHRQTDQQTNHKKLSYRRETARQLHTSFSAHSLIVHFTEHRICFTTVHNRLAKLVSTLAPNKPCDIRTLS